MNILINTKKLFMQFGHWLNDVKHKIYHIIILILLIFMDGIGLEPEIIIHRKHIHSTPEQLLLMSITFLTYIIIIFLAYKLYKRMATQNEVSKFKSHWHKLPSKKQVKRIFITIMLMFVTSLVLSPISNIVSQQKTSPNQDVLNKIMSLGTIPLLTIIIVSIFLAPIVEELLFRGCFINLFKYRQHYIFLSVPILLSGFLFSCCHMSSNIFSFLDYMISGMLLAYAYTNTHSLKTSICSHSIWNFLGNLAIIMHMM